jgi:hypothetical protein
VPPRVTLKNSTFKDVGTAIRADGPIDLSLENISLDNVRTPFDLRAGGSVTASGTRIMNDPKLLSIGKNATGWSRPSGPPLPVFCPACKSIFPSRNYAFGGMYFNAWDNEETCPECGSAHAKLSEGIFDLAGETVRIISAPDITHAMLAAIKKTTDEFNSGKITPQAAVTQLNKISPKLARLFRKTFSTCNSLLTALSVLIGIACLVAALQQTELAKEQTGIAREQLALQKHATDPAIALEKVLERFSAMVLQSQAMEPQQKKRTPKKRRAQKSKPKSKLKSVPVERLPPQKPNVRQ